MERREDVGRECRTPGRDVLEAEEEVLISYFLVAEMLLSTAKNLILDFMSSQTGDCGSRNLGTLLLSFYVFNKPIYCSL